MRLPGQSKAIVTKRKASKYLLARDHPTGRHKALWLTEHGFQAAAWHVLAAALVRHAREHDVARVEDSPFGKRYVVEGRIVTPDGRDPIVRSVWFIEAESNVPRLVTVYPLRRRVA